MRKAYPCPLMANPKERAKIERRFSAAPSGADLCKECEQPCKKHLRKGKDGSCIENAAAFPAHFESPELPRN